MRGAPFITSDNSCSARIIPADAGSTVRYAPCRRKSGDHPRGCGEHYHFSDIFNTPLGSSPRMRGAQPHPIQNHLTVGIIPADAGSTFSSWDLMDAERDHPRGCGEHLLMAYSA